MEKMESKNPLDGSVVGTVDVTDVGLIEELLEKSAMAQKGWGELSVERRAEILLPVAQLLEAESESLAQLMSQEMGKPVKVAAGEVKACYLSWKSEIEEMVEALKPETQSHNGVDSEIRFEPLGVSAAITPWNFPMLMPQWQILPTLMAGNSVVFKPSEETPLVAQAYADILNQVLPEGVLIVTHGAADQGRALVASAKTKLVTFTGSKAAGLHIMAEASKSLKRVVLELGGKDPLLVLEGADIEKAATFAANNSFRNSGQVCVSTERIYVQDSVYDDFKAAFTKATAGFVVGDSSDPSTDIGPMVNYSQKSKVMQQVEKAIASGAEALAGGGVEAGAFVHPTILTNVDHEMEVMTEETFGPVVGLMKVESPEQAIRLANDTPYGLGAVVFAESSLAEKVAGSLDAGMVGINKGVSGVMGTPWVGAKASGYGFHSSKLGHRQFAQIKVLSRPGEAS